MNPAGATGQRRWREIFLALHLYLGLFAGVILVITGITGSIIAFGGEIDAWLNQDLTKAVGEGAARPVDEIFAAARAALPPGAIPRYLNLPRDPERSASLIYEPGNDTTASDTYELFVDRASLKVLGHRLIGRLGHPAAAPIISFITQLHYTLLLGETGVIVVGVVSIGLLLSVITGIILWWPRRGNWAAAFRIKPNAPAVRLNYDIHKTVGWLSSIVLVVVLFSGIYMNLPQYVTPLVELFSPAPGWPENIQSTPSSGTPITPGAAAAIVDKLFPDGELMGIGLPAGPTDPYFIRKHAPDEVTQAYSHRQVWIDQFSGRILAVTDPHHYTAGQRFLEWQYPLHSGEAFGLAGRIIIAVVGIVCPLLYVTGLIRWAQKRERRRGRSKAWS